MGFSTSYEEINDDYGTLPEGEYEVVIRNIEERTTPNGATGLNLSLVIRNDVEQNYKDRYIFYTLWKRKEPTAADKQVQGYGFKQVMRLAKSAGLPSGKAYETLEDMCKDLMHRPLKVTLEHREYNGKTQENVKCVNASEHPDCKHVFKEATPQKSNDVFAQPATAQAVNLSDFEEVVSDSDVPF